MLTIRNNHTYNARPVELLSSVPLTGEYSTKQLSLYNPGMDSRCGRGLWVLPCSHDLSASALCFTSGRTMYHSYLFLAGEQDLVSVSHGTFRPFI